MKSCRHSGTLPRCNRFDVDDDVDIEVIGRYAAMGKRGLVVVASVSLVQAASRERTRHAGGCD